MPKSYYMTKKGKLERMIRALPKGTKLDVVALAKQFETTKAHIRACLIEWEMNHSYVRNTKSGWKVGNRY